MLSLFSFPDQAMVLPTGTLLKTVSTYLGCVRLNKKLYMYVHVHIMYISLIDFRPLFSPEIVIVRVTNSHIV